MQRVLVVYYSRTGHVRSVAQAIADACSADLEEIREARPRRGLFAWIRSSFEAARGRCPPILPLVRSPSDYELVVLGCPVWASRVASPMRSFLASNAPTLPHVAFFCTMGGRGGERMFGEMTTLCGKEPIAALILRDRELNEPAIPRRIAAFVEALGVEERALTGAAT